MNTSHFGTAVKHNQSQTSVSDDVTEIFHYISYYQSHVSLPCRKRNFPPHSQSEASLTDIWFHSQSEANLPNDVTGSHPCWRISKLNSCAQEQPYGLPVSGGFFTNHENQHFRMFKHYVQKIYIYKDSNSWAKFHMHFGYTIILCTILVIDLRFHDELPLHMSQQIHLSHFSIELINIF